MKKVIIHYQMKKIILIKTQCFDPISGNQKAKRKRTKHCISYSKVPLLWLLHFSKGVLGLGSRALLFI
jgi:hypothetical protein